MFSLRADLSLSLTGVLGGIVRAQRTLREALRTTLGRTMLVTALNPLALAAVPLLFLVALAANLISLAIIKHVQLITNACQTGK